jgi:hypothetical protein
MSKIMHVKEGGKIGLLTCALSRAQKRGIVKKAGQKNSPCVVAIIYRTAADSVGPYLGPP